MGKARNKAMTKREAELAFEELTAASERLLAELRALKPGKQTMPRRRALQQEYADVGVAMRKALDVIIA